MAEQETQPLGLLPGIDAFVLIYHVKAGQEANIESLCTGDLRDFLAEDDDTTHASFWTVTLNVNVDGQPKPVTLLVSAVDAWGSDWVGSVPRMKQCVEAVTVTEHPPWTVNK